MQLFHKYFRSELKGHAKAEKNRNPEAKIIQTLQINSMFVSKERGVWQIA